jgi:2-oxoglutarate ferredoxin oxidoreductase subunit delta
MRFWRIPLDSERFVRPQGRIFILVERCKGCGFCVEYCPRQVLQISTRFNKKGYHYPEAVQEDACVDCDLCESLCPEFAIYSECVEARLSAPADPDAAQEVERG